MLRRKAAAAQLAKHDKALLTLYRVRCAEAVELLRGIDTDWLLHEEADRIGAAIDVLLKGDKAVGAE
ncbi:hypothetical protein [Streptomyces sp. NPDC057545]|uniref:hypothetical protein n=1 Tax=Streptomyces sp. NPDC057545 TaxID=3346164 RepID=UPI0036B3BE8F